MTATENYINQLSAKKFADLHSFVVKEHKRRLVEDRFKKINRKKNGPEIIVAIRKLRDALKEIPREIEIEGEILGIKIKAKGCFNTEYDNVAVALTREYNSLYPEFDDFVHKLPAGMKKAQREFVSDLLYELLGDVCSDGWTAIFGNECRKLPKAAQAAFNKASGLISKSRLEIADIFFVTQAVFEEETE